MRSALYIGQDPNWVAVHLALAKNMSRNSQFLCLCAVFSAFLWVLSTFQPTNTLDGIWFELEAPLDYLPPQTLTAILPILPNTLGELNHLLRPLLDAVEQIHEIIIVCPQTAAFDVRRQLRATFTSLRVADLDVSLWPWQPPITMDVAVLGCVSQLTTEWALIMDENGLKEVTESVRAALLRPPNVSLPLGPEGLKHKNYIPVSSQWGLLQPAWYLYPPFIMPSAVARTFKINHNDEKLWSQLGSHVARSRADGIGGLRLHVAAGLNGSSNILNQPPPTDRSPGNWLAPLPINIHNDSFPSTTPLDGSQTGFIFFLPTLVDLDKVSFLVCRLLGNATRPHIRVLIYEGLHPSPHLLGWKSGVFESDNCAIDYDILTGTRSLSFSAEGSMVLTNWLTGRPGPTCIVFTLKELDPLVSFMNSHGKNTFPRATFISVPRTDLEYTGWMSSLTITEWQSKSRVFQDCRI